MKRLLFITLFLCLLPATLLAEFPKPAGFVTDSAGIIDAQTKRDLTSFLTSFEKQTGVEVAVATVSSLDELPIDDYAVELFKKWGIGKKGKDNGVLFLIAPNERKMRIEVGYGLEGAINDALAGRIMDRVVIPFFKSGEISRGVANGTISIVDTVVTNENLQFDPQKEIKAYEGLPQYKKKKGPLSILGKILMLLVMGYLFIRHPWLFLFFLGGFGGGGGRTGGGFGGGSGGFGGGLSGGGGASRGW
jgi:uncharacterized protein